MATAVHAVTATPATTTTHDETIHTTANHPWLTADHGWLLAGTLQVGEPVLTATGNTAIVEAVRVVPGAASMWDLTVSTVHDFAVGDGAFVVHNCGGAGADGAKALRQVDRTDGSVNPDDLTHNLAYADANIGGSSESVRAYSGRLNPASPSARPALHPALHPPRRSLSRRRRTPRTGRWYRSVWAFQLMCVTGERR